MAEALNLHNHLNYTAPWWLPGGQLQTIAPALFSKPHPTRTDDVPVQRERWLTPDGDFVDVDMALLKNAADRQPVLLCLFHGLEGSARSHYARAFAHWCGEHGLDFVLPHFRGCSGEINHTPRAYHSGDHEEIGWILGRVRARFPQHRVVAAGVSLGGNALMRWAGEQGQEAAPLVSAVASVCSPIDLRASGMAIGRGFNRLVYTPMFLRSLKPKAERKWQQFPGLFDLERMRRSRDLYEFDDVFTAPLHGFLNTEDYWSRASAKPVLDRIRIPALVLNARNDPFVPASCLPAQVAGDWVRLWQPQDGGHVGFAAGQPLGHLQAMPQAVGAWLLDAAGYLGRGGRGQLVQQLAG